MIALHLVLYFFKVKLNLDWFKLDLLIELDKKVFGKITTKEIIGSDPPAIPDTRDLLENELKLLLGELESTPTTNLEKILEEQNIAEQHINSRPGAMALAQNKIKIFNEYNDKYVKSVKQKLNL